MVAVSLYGTFYIWENLFEDISYKFCAIISYRLLPSSRLKIHIYFRLFRQTTVIERPSLIRKEKTACEKCGTQTRRNNIVRQKKRCSLGTLYCTQCPYFSTKSQNYLNYYIAMKHTAPKLDITFKCKICYQEFPGFYALRQRRNTQHGIQIGSVTRHVDVGDVADHRLRAELHSCQHFLEDFQMERARHKVINYAMETLNKTIVNEKLHLFFNI